MRPLHAGAAVAALLALLVAPGCGGTTPVSPAVSTSFQATAATVRFRLRAADNTSILKKLTKNVVIGSTVDPKNGDTGPRAISIAQTKFGLKPGQLLVCNYADASGAPGKGTTIELFTPKPNGKPTPWAQNADIAGCVGDAIATLGNQVYAAGQTAGLLVWFDQNGNFQKSFGAPLAEPLGNADVFANNFYEPDYIMTSDAKTGSIVSLSAGHYGNGNLVQVVTGFAVNKASGWSVLGPSGLSYDKNADTLYVVDGVDDTVVAIAPASNLLLKNEIVVRPGGKTFKCAHAKNVCAKLVYSGKPLDAPLAATVLPNGNLIVANTKGGNTLVEITPAGKVLATKVVDKAPNAAVFGLAAAGASDKDTVLFYTDTNKNELEELKQ